MVTDSLTHKHFQKRTDISLYLGLISRILEYLNCEVFNKTERESCPPDRGLDETIPQTSEIGRRPAQIHFAIHSPTPCQETEGFLCCCVPLDFVGLSRTRGFVWFSASAGNPFRPDTKIVFLFGSGKVSREVVLKTYFSTESEGCR